MAPGSRSALYAIKPTIKYKATDGVLSVALTFDTIGGMAKSAEDLAMLTAIILNPLALQKLPATGYIGSMNRS